MERLARQVGPLLNYKVLDESSELASNDAFIATRKMDGVHALAHICTAGDGLRHVVLAEMVSCSRNRRRPPGPSTRRMPLQETTWYIFDVLRSQLAPGLHRAPYRERLQLARQIVSQDDVMILRQFSRDRPQHPTKEWRSLRNTPGCAFRVVDEMKGTWPQLRTKARRACEAVCRHCGGLHTEGVVLTPAEPRGWRIRRAKFKPWFTARGVVYARNRKVALVRPLPPFANPRMKTISVHGTAAVGETVRFRAQYGMDSNAWQINLGNR